jgi:hypothetical protein
MPNTIYIPKAASQLLPYTGQLLLLQVQVATTSAVEDPFDLGMLLAIEFSLFWALLDSSSRILPTSQGSWSCWPVPSIVGKIVTLWQFACLASHVVYRQYISCSCSLSALHLQHNTVFYLLVVGPSLYLILLVTVLAYRHCLYIDLIPCYTSCCIYCSNRAILPSI